MELSSMILVMAAILFILALIQRHRSGKKKYPCEMPEDISINVINPNELVLEHMVEGKTPSGLIIPRSAVEKKEIHNYFVIRGKSRNVDPEIRIGDIAFFPLNVINNGAFYDKPISWDENGKVLITKQYIILNAGHVSYTAQLKDTIYGKLDHRKFLNMGTAMSEGLFKDTDPHMNIKVPPKGSKLDVPNIV